MRAWILPIRPDFLNCATNGLSAQQITWKSFRVILQTEQHVKSGKERFAKKKKSPAEPDSVKTTICSDGFEWVAHRRTGAVVTR